jgi:hypothetical protein
VRLRFARRVAGASPPAPPSGAWPGSPFGIPLWLRSAVASPPQEAVPYCEQPWLRSPVGFPSNELSRTTNAVAEVGGRPSLDNRERLAGRHRRRARTHQRNHLLAHQHRRILGPLLLQRPPRRPHRPRPRPASPSTSGHCGGSPSATTPRSCPGTNTTAAATGPPKALLTS